MRTRGELVAGCTVPEREVVWQVGSPVSIARRHCYTACLSLSLRLLMAQTPRQWRGRTRWDFSRKREKNAGTLKLGARIEQTCLRESREERHEQLRCSLPRGCTRLCSCRPGGIGE